MTIALLSKPWGIRGEMTAFSFSDHPERFDDLGRVFLFGSNPEPRELEVESVRNQKGSLLFKFRGIESIEDADPWRNAEVRIPKDERVALAPDEVFLSDLIGCQVVERATGKVLGAVTGLADGGPSGLLQVGNGLLIPFVKSICVVIDTAARRVEVELPEGLRELNES